MCFVFCHVFLILFVTTPLLKVNKTPSQTLQQPPYVPIYPKIYNLVNLVGSLPQVRKTKLCDTLPNSKSRTANDEYHNRREGGQYRSEALDLRSSNAGFRDSNPNFLKRICTTLKKCMRFLYYAEAF